MSVDINSVTFNDGDPTSLLLGPLAADAQVTLMADNNVALGAAAGLDPVENADVLIRVMGTGEPLQLDLKAGDELYAATIPNNGPVTVWWLTA